MLNNQIYKFYLFGEAVFSRTIIIKNKKKSSNKMAESQTQAILRGNPLELLLNEAMMGIMPFDDYYASFKPDVMLTPVENENFQIGTMYCISGRNVYIKSISVTTNLDPTEKMKKLLKKYSKQELKSMEEVSLKLFVLMITSKND